MNILVTGGSGFIGSHFIEEMLKRDDVKRILNVDVLTYAANRTLPFDNNPKYKLVVFDIKNSSFIQWLMAEDEIDVVVHFAAESHVDNSIYNADPFVTTNVYGTYNVLKSSLAYGKLKKFIHVSTDEVYGSLSATDTPFTVNHPYRPNSPYAASKASSDLMVRSFVQTYQFPAIITNCSNNFGPRQNREKLIPTCIRNLKNKTPIPLYGNGSNIRDWIYVKDHVNTLIKIIDEGKVGKQYLIGGEMEMSNLELITNIKERYVALTGQEVDWQWYNTVTDRKGHDQRYAIDNSDLIKEFGRVDYNNFTKALDATIVSYIS